MVKRFKVGDMVRVLPNEEMNSWKNYHRVVDKILTVTHADEDDVYLLDYNKYGINFIPECLELVSDREYEAPEGYKYELVNDSKVKLVKIEPEVKLTVGDKILLNNGIKALVIRGDFIDKKYLVDGKAILLTNYHNGDDYYSIANGFLKAIKNGLYKVLK